MNCYMFSASILSLLWFLCNLETCKSIRCQKSVVVNGSVAVGECTGDYCISITSYVTNGQSNTVLGCISGYDSVSVGCIKDTLETRSCVCNDTNYCNANATEKTYKPPVEVECYNGKVVNGKLVGNERCKGRLCLLSLSPLGDGKLSEMVASCADVSDRRRMFDNKVGCLYFSSPEGTSDAWSCRCNENLCNLRSIKTPKASRKVECLLGGSQPLEEKGLVVDGAAVKNDTCTGDFCMLTPLDTNLGISARGCVSLSNGALLYPKIITTDLMVGNFEMYLCNTDYCNKDVEHSLANILNSIRKK